MSSISLSDEQEGELADGQVAKKEDLGEELEERNGNIETKGDDMAGTLTLRGRLGEVKRRRKQSLVASVCTCSGSRGTDVCLLVMRN